MTREAPLAAINLPLNPRVYSPCTRDFKRRHSVDKPIAQYDPKDPFTMYVRSGEEVIKIDLRPRSDETDFLVYYRRLCDDMKRPDLFKQLSDKVDGLLEQVKIHGEFVVGKQLGEQVRTGELDPMLANWIVLLLKERLRVTELHHAEGIVSEALDRARSDSKG